MGTTIKLNATEPAARIIFADFHRATVASCRAE